MGRDEGRSLQNAFMRVLFMRWKPDRTLLIMSEILIIRWIVLICFFDGVKAEKVLFLPFLRLII